MARGVAIRGVVVVVGDCARNTHNAHGSSVEKVPARRWSYSSSLAFRLAGRFRKTPSKQAAELRTAPTDPDPPEWLGLVRVREGVGVRVRGRARVWSGVELIWVERCTRSKHATSDRSARCSLLGRPAQQHVYWDNKLDTWKECGTSSAVLPALTPSELTAHACSDTMHLELAWESLCSDVKVEPIKNYWRFFAKSSLELVLFIFCRGKGVELFLSIPACV